MRLVQNIFMYSPYGCSGKVQAKPVRMAVEGAGAPRSARSARMPRRTSNVEGASTTVPEAPMTGKLQAKPVPVSADDAQGALLRPALRSGGVIRTWWSAAGGPTLLRSR